MDKKKMYINGEWIEGTSGKTFQSVNPATGAVNAEVCQSSLEDTKAAIDAAYTAFYETREWRDMDAQFFCYGLGDRALAGPAGTVDRNFKNVFHTTLFLTFPVSYSSAVFRFLPQMY